MTQRFCRATKRRRWLRSTRGSRGPLVPGTPRRSSWSIFRSTWERSGRRCRWPGSETSPQGVVSGVQRGRPLRVGARRLFRLQGAMVSMSMSGQCGEDPLGTQRSSGSLVDSWWWADVPSCTQPE
jgi:hypothetical protein